jgi:HD superfamily phosphohydrolase
MTETERNAHLIRPSRTVSFADIAHQTLLFNTQREPERLVLELLDSRWMQRLRSISQTGNTKLVYMFAEHSRFGHSLGVAYLATLLMRHLGEYSPERVRPFETAVAAAALLHDIGHVAPGSHLGEKVWSSDKQGRHEALSVRIILEDKELREILDRYDPQLAQIVCAILSDSDTVPPWTRSIISGGGWNADRGNWAIVDSAMCCVSYGRYNVLALIDAFRLSESGELVLLESRLDALTHFFVARDSMYRQVYQHRVLQAVDVLSLNIVRRIRSLLPGTNQTKDAVEAVLNQHRIFADTTMRAALSTLDYVAEPLETIFDMTEPWWYYHINAWCRSTDPILSDLAHRLRDRRLFKTIRVETGPGGSREADVSELIARARTFCEEEGFDPDYYVTLIEEKDKHRGKAEEAPLALLDTGEVLPVTEVEPMIDQIMKRSTTSRTWLAVPARIKEKLGRLR